MKIAINKKIINGPWGGGNQILTLIVNYLRKNGIEVVFSMSNDVDAVLLMDVRKGSCSFPLSDLLKYNVPVIHRINDTGSHRANDEGRTKVMLDENLKYANYTVFISDWVKEYYVNKGFEGRNVVINNAADRSLFYPSNIVRKPKDTIKIVTHHWSDNISKGYDIYKNIDNFCKSNENFEFKFIGKRDCVNKFSNKCNKIMAKPYKEIPPFLRTEDVYVSASLFEAGGCHIVEGMACGLIPIVRKGGGGTESYSNGMNFVFSSSDELFKYLNELYNNYNLFIDMKNKVTNEYKYNSDEMCQKYYETILKSFENK